MPADKTLLYDSEGFRVTQKGVPSTRLVLSNPDHCTLIVAQGLILLKEATRLRTLKRLAEQERAAQVRDLENALDQIANYEALLSVLGSREFVSDMQKRLRFYYLARGIEVGELSMAKSNILIGSTL